jgi:hypothetical protein
MLAGPDREACTCDLTEPLGLTQLTVTHHLRKLAAAGWWPPTGRSATSPTTGSWSRRCAGSQRCSHRPRTDRPASRPGVEVALTGCVPFGCTRRWSRNGAWARALTVLHAAARRPTAAGRRRRRWWSSTPTWRATRPTVGSPSTARSAGLNPREPNDRADAGAPDRAGRRRPPRPVPATGEVIREHHHLRDRLASGRLHRFHPAPPIACSGWQERTSGRSVTAHGNPADEFGKQLG